VLPTVTPGASLTTQLLFCPFLTAPRTRLLLLTLPSPHTSTGIDWDLLEQKHLEPPYKPERAKMLDELVPYPSFEALMHDFGKADWLDDPPAATEQKYFSNWYVCFVRHVLYASVVYWWMLS
jgi:hypothetical protein